MKLLAILVVVFACGKKADVDGWSEVERMATPAIPSADGSLLDDALKIYPDHVPEVAIEHAIAWRKANGGVSWRTDRSNVLDVRPFKLGEALIDRDPATALYLAYRLRAENTNFIGVAMGFALTQRVLDEHPAWQVQYAAWAPTDDEIRRALAAEAVMFLDNIPPNDKVGRPKMTRWYAELLVDAPRDRAAFLAHVDRMIAKVQGTELQIIVTDKLRKRLDDMYKTIDAYRAWQGK
jgi:hypothetical protein